MVASGGKHAGVTERQRPTIKIQTRTHLGGPVALLLLPRLVSVPRMPPTLLVPALDGCV